MLGRVRATSEEPIVEPPSDEPSDDAIALDDRPRRPMDPWLFFAACALAALGLVMVYSAGSWLGFHTHKQWEYFLVRQAAFLGAGFALMLVVSRIDYRVLRRFAPHFMFIAMGLLVVVLFTGQEINGARRWIRFGALGLQPSEVAKVTLVIFLAATLARQGERVRAFRTGFLPVMVVAGLTMVLVLLEKDLGTTILIGALTLVMTFVAGTRLSYVVAAILLAAPLVWYQILGVDYRRGRLEEFLSGDSYQVQQALIAVGSGGTWGLGLGNGRQKLGFLPENHTDFVLATIGEELGFAGIALVMLLIGLLVWRGIAVARAAEDRFGMYLAAGISSLFGLQALVNMAVVLELIPAKGITLPLLSYGGSSLLAAMGAIGLLLSVSRSPEPWRWSDQRSRERSNARATAKTKAATREEERAPARAGDGLRVSDLDWLHAEHRLIRIREHAELTHQRSQPLEIAGDLHPAAAGCDSLLSGPSPRYCSTRLRGARIHRELDVLVVVHARRLLRERERGGEPTELVDEPELLRALARPDPPARDVLDRRIVEPAAFADALLEIDVHPVEPRL